MAFERNTHTNRPAFSTLSHASLPRLFLLGRVPSLLFYSLVSLTSTSGCELSCAMSILVSRTPKTCIVPQPAGDSVILLRDSSWFQIFGSHDSLLSRHSLSFLYPDRLSVTKSLVLNPLCLTGHSLVTVRQAFPAQPLPSPKLSLWCCLWWPKIHLSKHIHNQIRYYTTLYIMLTFHNLHVIRSPTASLTVKVQKSGVTLVSRQSSVINSSWVFLASNPISSSTSTNHPNLVTHLLFPLSLLRISFPSTMDSSILKYQSPTKNLQLF